MSETILSVDLREFRAAVTEYANETRKDAATVLNRKAASMFFAAAKAAPRARPAKLRGKAKSPRYVATLLSRKGGYTVEEARAYSAALARRMVRAVGFLRAWLRSCGNAVNGKPARKARGVENRIHRASAGDLVVSVDSSYRFGKKTGSPAILEGLLAAATRKGVAAETADTRRHVAERMARRAREHSGK